MPDEVLLQERDGAIAVLTLNRPKAKNALDAALASALGAALHGAAEDPAVRVIVLGGAGGSFCSGADLKAAFVENPDLTQGIDAAIGGSRGAEPPDVIDRYHAMIRAIVGAPKPVIAMVDGPAVGFGCDLALACDLRVLSTGAYLQEKFVKIGLMPDGGGTFWLPRLVGLARAMEIMLAGEPIDAARALELGIANRVVPPGALREETITFARKLAKGPPIAFAEIKRAMRASHGGIDGALDAEKKGQMRCLASSDCMEGVTAWMQKREPEFQGK